MIEFAIKENITFDNVVCWHRQMHECLTQTHEDVEFTFSSCAHCDSSSLTLLLSIMRYAKSLGVTCFFTGLPDALIHIASVYGLNDYLAPVLRKP